ncbi:haloacid dehalogenase [Microbispora rosea subsp. aerata]|nr:HAD-IIA family hydrolase [Microbispora rosea]GGO24700.1 haloacid dehalogenase [Microbispora rosea subsp. aerata]GIH58084.1 haloacid dehalogenase [Microbispora rosea subsp. aerata]GLJ82363.1 haloacid dehalogenase [Microbispora rosea subsp. aerata]
MPKITGALVDAYDTLLLDLDGVVYLGRHAVPGAAEALVKARDRGVRLAFVTNNASRTPGAIAQHLNQLNIPAAAEDVVTSAQAAARLVAEHVPAGSAVLVVGGMGLRMALREHGLRPVTTAMDAPAAVVQGFADNLSYGLLSEGALAVRQGAWFVAANGDATMPTGRGKQPGNGSLSRVIATATGVEPVIAGKPEPPLHRESMIRTRAERPLIVGDRLDTDIEGATRAGVDSLLVLTGVAGALDVLTAAPRHRPTHIAADLSGLHAPVVPVRRGPGGWTCGGWTAGWEDGKLWLTGEGDPVEGLRAACAATWEAVGDGQADEDAVKAAVAALDR